MISTRLVAEAAEAEEDLNPLIPHTAEIILGLVVFALLFFIVAKKIVPLFEKAYAERTAAIEGGIEDAQRTQKEADEALATYNAQLADLRSEAASIREEAKEQAAQIKAEARAEAQAEAERIVSTAHAQIEAERAQVVAQLKGEVGSLATDLAGRIVGESLEDDDRQKRTVERFIAELEGSAN